MTNVGESCYFLDVVYPLSHYPAMDAVIKKAVGKNSSASGAGFGERDLQFEFETDADAMAAAERVNALPDFGQKVEWYYWKYTED